MNVICSYRYGYGRIHQCESRGRVHSKKIAYKGGGFLISRNWAVLCPPFSPLLTHCKLSCHLPRPFQVPVPVAVYPLPFLAVPQDVVCQHQSRSYSSFSSSSWRSSRPSYSWVSSGTCDANFVTRGRSSLTKRPTLIGACPSCGRCGSRIRKRNPVAANGSGRISESVFATSQSPLPPSFLSFPQTVPPPLYARY
jgi:hypothetical protein